MSFPWPQPNEVHIHCVPLAASPAHYVSPEELRRAGRLRDPCKRSLFMASRGLLRAILAGYLKTEPKELRISVGEHGKPYLFGNEVRLNFNLSHSGSLFLLAVAADREVGIDVEQIRDETPFADMARLSFSPREQEELFILPDNLQQSAFYRCWTRKEACMKACGMGFALPSNSFDVSLSPHATSSLSAPTPLSPWSLQDIHVPEGYCAAVAVPGANPVIRYMD